MILSTILGIVLVWNTSSAIAEIREPSLTPLSNNEELESGKTDFPVLKITDLFPGVPETSDQAADPDEDIYELIRFGSVRQFYL